MSIYFPVCFQFDSSGRMSVFPRFGCIARSVEVWLREQASSRSVGPWLVCRPVGQSVCRSAGGQSVGRPLRRRSVGRSVGRSVVRWVGPSVGPSVGRSVGRSVGQSVGQSVSQSVSRSITQISLFTTGGGLHPSQPPPLFDSSCAPRRTSCHHVIATLRGKVLRIIFFANGGSARPHPTRV